MTVSQNMLSQLKEQVNCGIDKSQLLVLDNFSGQLMAWASKTTTVNADVYKAARDDELINIISEEVMRAIEKSLMEDIESAVTSPVSNHDNIKSTFRPNSAAHLEEITNSDFYYSQSLSLKEIMERIWKLNDQKASYFLQERLRQAVPGEFENLMELVLQNSEVLMVHRFGNFLVQCMLELAQPEDIALFACHLSGRIAEMSKNQFCCHVIQRLLDVGYLVIQARVAAELLDDVVETMTSPFGTHVWQKLLHLPWPANLPSITSLANNAVHLEPNTRGWMAIVSTEAGCATTRSFLFVSKQEEASQECINELLMGIPELIVRPASSTLVPRLAMLAQSRARAIMIIISNARAFSKHPIASTVLIVLLKMKIPSFPARLKAVLLPYYNELFSDRYGQTVLSALGSTPPATQRLWP